MKKKIKIFCTLGPSSFNKETIIRLDRLGVDMFRINLSHTEIKDLKRLISLIKNCTSKPICLDTEGAQVRIGYVKGNKIYLEENDIVEISREKVIGCAKRFSFTPGSSVDQIRAGDLINIDFESALLVVVQSKSGLATAKVISGGYVGSNRAVTIDRDV